MLSGSLGPEEDGSRASLLMASIPFNRLLGTWAAGRLLFSKLFILG